MEAVNNSGEKAKWIKSEIPGEEYVCSLCGGACWYYDVQKDVAEVNFVRIAAQKCQEQMNLSMSMN